jgi:hypothetical protein
LQTQSGFAVHYTQRVTHLHRDAGGWRIEARDTSTFRASRPDPHL